MSTSEIARRIGCTKNQAISKAHRLGLGPHNPTAFEEQRRRREATKPANPFEPFFDVPIWCRWPIGHPGDPDFHFCGVPHLAPGKPYCERHASVAYYRGYIREWTEGDRLEARKRLLARNAAGTHRE